MSSGRERTGGGRLATRLALAAGLGVLALAAGLVLASSHHFLQAHEEAIGREQTVLVATAAQGIGDAIDLAHRSLERTAASVPAELLRDPLAARAFLEGQGGLRALFEDGLALVDVRGRVVAATWPASLQVSPAGVLRVPAVEPGELVSSPYEAAGDPGRPAVALRAALHAPGGELRGWLHGGVALDGSAYLGGLARSRIGERGFFGAVAADRTVLLHRDPALVLRPAGPPGENAALDRGLAGQEGWGIVRARGAGEVISAASRVPSTGWAIVASYPLDEARAPFVRARTAFLAVALIASVVLLAAVLALARRLTRPLGEMTARVEALAAGRAVVRPLAVRGAGEVATLAAAFDRLVEQRGRAEAELRASEARFRRAFQTSPEPMTLSRLDDGVMVAVNAGFERLHGVREADVVGRPGHTLALWVDPAERLAIVDRVRREGTVREVDARVRGARGEELTIAFSASAVEIDGVPHMFALSRDVTAEREAARERERLASELRASEERYRFMARSVPVVQWALDREGRFTLSEGRGLAKLGLAPGQVVGRPLHEVYRDFPGILDHYRRAAAGESFAALDSLGFVTFESHWGPIRNDAGEIVGVTGIGLDITDRIEAEAARKAADVRAGMLERLAATGRLAAGVAHEINNPLTYLLGNLDDALQRLRAGGADEETVQRVAEAREGAERVRAIVSDLRMFARGDADERGSCDAAAVARSAAHLVANEIRHRARLEQRFEPAPPAAIAERRLAQVLVNLLVNACQAVPEGRAAEHEIRLAVREEAGRVLVEVSDTGVGMTDEVRRRVFEPFFTTRKVGDGMGLGLALSHSMVTDAGGELEVESAPGRGSTFRVRLPAARAEGPAEVKPAAPPAAAVAGPAPAAPAAPGRAPEPPPTTLSPARLKVLLVDDEPLVARAVARQLREFEVDTETSAAGALARMRGGARYDAVICDLMMPEQTGMDLHARLVADGDAVAARFVFLTGGAFTDRARAFVASTTAPVLEKPVDAAALKAAVRAVAGAPGGV